MSISSGDTAPLPPPDGHNPVGVRHSGRTPVLARCKACTLVCFYAVHAPYPFERERNGGSEVGVVAAVEKSSSVPGRYP